MGADVGRKIRISRPVLSMHSVPKHSRIEPLNRCDIARPAMEFRLQAVGRGKPRRSGEFSTRLSMLSPCRLKPELHTRMRTPAPGWSDWGFSAIRVYGQDWGGKRL